MVQQCLDRLEWLCLRRVTKMFSDLATELDFALDVQNWNAGQEEGYFVWAHGRPLQTLNLTHFLTTQSILSMLSR